MTAANPPVQSASTYKGLLARHPLVFFFLIAYAGTWLFELPYVLSEDGSGLLPFSSPVAQWMMPVSIFMGPFLAAFVMTGVTEGREGVGRFLRRFVLWRVGFRWYLFVLVGVPALFVLSIIVLPGGLGSFQGLGALAPPLSLLGWFVYAFFPGGALGEEPGWRGFALPRLQSLHGPLLGSLILGPLWGLWHLPLFFTPWNEFTALNVVGFALVSTCLAIMYTWVFNNTKGSILIAVLLHATFNWTTVAVGPLFPAPIFEDYGLLTLLGGFGAFAVVLVVLTRGRLGYQHYQQEEEPDLATAST
jgi:membrane protease YdiL (CAAX protease family)